MLFQRFYNRLIASTVAAMTTPPATTEIPPAEATVGGTDATEPTEAAASTSQPQPPPLAPTPFVRPPPSQTFDPAAAFMEAYDCAKMNNNWNKVSSSLMIHPEWLSRIPAGRRWTMLHQIVFSGNVMHLNEVLALQASNPEFRLLCRTSDNKTVREVAAERAHIHPQMMRRIERLVAVDQLLNNAKDRKWELVKQCISMQPDIVNEKPPYRRFYLAHHLACVGELDIFKDLSKICHFKLDLLAENKTISQTAREHNQIAFAEHIESLAASPSEATGDGADDEPLPPLTAPTHHSPSFYQDLSISFLPVNVDVTTLLLPTSNSLPYSSGTHSTFTYQADGDDFGYHPPTTLTTPAATSGPPSEAAHGATAVEPKPAVPEMSASEQAAYEQTVMSNIHKMSQENLLKSITCCITKEILHDPVVAADGFTYERQAILTWFEHSNRSPMTNQELENLELKPNYAIKSILQLLQGGSPSSESS